MKRWTHWVDRDVIKTDSALGKQLRDIAIGQAMLQAPAGSDRDPLTLEPGTQRTRTSMAGPTI